MSVMNNDLICLLCPNGCHLTLQGREDREIGLAGQGCERGIEFVRQVLKDDRDKAIVPERPAAYDERTLAEIAAFWGISLAKVHRSLIPAGSPERTLFRTVIEDGHGECFVLEKIPASALCKKLLIIRTLAFLADKGLAGSSPYREGAGGEAIRNGSRGLWQLAPYVAGVALDRETYLYEGWRAEVLARFLIGLREMSRGIPFFLPEETFSLAAYMKALIFRIEGHAPGLLQRLRPTLAFLEKRFMEAHDRLPTSFCHGDYHPLNIVWGDQEIRAVIDWEFTGLKPEIYDLANMVGCLGVEHPSSLTGELVTGLIDRLRDAGLYTEISWTHFLEFVVALRFAWLSEWLRKGDAEMIDLELDYMALLISHQARLRHRWEI